MTRYLNRAPVLVAALAVMLLPAKLLTSPHDSTRANRVAPKDPAHNGADDRGNARRALKEMRKQVMSARPLAMYYTSGGTFGLDAVQDHASDMTILAPQCYWLDQNGSIQGSLPVATLEAARQARLPVMALLGNNNFSRRVASVLLRNRGLQKRVIRKLASIARQEGLVGIQLDLENIDPEEINLYTRFVHDAAKEFHHDGRLLSVAVVPRFLDSAPGQWAAAYDYSGLARSADFLTLMAYDNSGRLGPPGPIAGYNWVKNALEYACRRVPVDKLLLGIPLYGREWTDDGHSLQARTIAYPETQALLERLSLKPQWNEQLRSPWFRYRTRGTVCSVWYENARSVQAKLQLLERYHLRGFAAWRLGVEDPRIWSLVSAMRGGTPEVLARQQATGF